MAVRRIKGIQFVASLSFLFGLTLATTAVGDDQQEPTILTSTKTLSGHEGQITSLAVSPDGRKLVAGGGYLDAGRLTVWEIRGNQIHTLLQLKSDFVSSVAFSPDSKTLAAACGRYDGQQEQNLGQTEIWDVATGKRTAVLKQHTDVVFCVTFSPDGKTLATGGADRTVNLWKMPEGKVESTFTGPVDFIGSVAFSPDGKGLASSSVDGTVHVWNIRTGFAAKTIDTRQRGIHSLAYSPNGKLLATSHPTGNVQLRAASTGRLIRTLKEYSGSPVCLAFSPNGSLLATAGFSNSKPANGMRESEILIWNANTGRTRNVLKGNTGNIMSVVFSPDGKTLFSGSEPTEVAGSELMVWNIAESAK